MFLILAAADVFAHQIQLGGGDVEHIGACVAQLHIVFFHPVRLQLDHALKATHTVVFVYNKVAGGQVGEAFQLVAVGCGFFGGTAYGSALPFGEDSKAQVGIFHAGGQTAHGDE